MAFLGYTSLDQHEEIAGKALELFKELATMLE